VSRYGCGSTPCRNERFPASRSNRRVSGAAIVALAAAAGCGGSQTLGPADRGEPPLVSAKLALAAPSDLTAVATSETQVEVTWTDNSSKESGFELYRSTSGPTGAFELRARIAMNARRFVDAPVLAGHQFCFRIRGFRGNGGTMTYSTFSSTACATTPTPTTPPPPPPPEVQGVEAIPNSSTEVGIYWDASAGAEWFRIERSSDHGITWTALTTTTVGSYYDSGLESDTEVCYRISGASVFAEGPPSAPDCTAPPGAPTNLTNTVLDDGGIDFRWNDNSTVEDEYQVYTLQVQDGHVAGTHLVANLPSNSTRFVCYMECDGRPVWVQAIKDGGGSDPSNMSW